MTRVGRSFRSVGSNRLERRNTRRSNRGNERRTCCNDQQPRGHGEKSHGIVRADSEHKRRHRPRKHEGKRNTDPHADDRRRQRATKHHACHGGGVRAERQANADLFAPPGDIARENTINADGSEELYDERTDPKEWTNLAKDPKLADILTEHRGWLQGEFRRGDPGAIADAGRAIGNYDARPFASLVDVPAAVVITTRDRLVRPSKQRELADAIPNALRFDLHADHDACLVSIDDFADVTVQAVKAVSDRV